MSDYPSFRLDGQTALVTGAGQGLGAEMAGALAEAGARVTLVDRDESGLAEDTVVTFLCLLQQLLIGLELVG